MKRMMTGVLAATATLLVPTFVTAQSANPLMDSVKQQHDAIKGNLLKTVEKVPENVWAFKATPEVRSFAEIVGHIADASLSICGAGSGQKAAPLNAEKTMTTKAQLSKALADAMAFCDKAIAGMDDKKAMEPTKFLFGPTIRASVIQFNTAHNFEHYGNLVTYMRLNKIVPPSSEGTGMN